MRRILASLLVLIAAGGYLLVASGAREDDSRHPSYWVELDNAFGITPGSDFKIAGVRAGKITQMKVDRRTHNALVGFQITQTGFSPIKTDVTCESRPQSLIGEYFIDCNPGRNATVLKPGSTIPVNRTYSTIPADVVNNVLRLPQRQRLRIILTELGAGVAARGEDLNEVLRRAVPALRETDELLNLLANESATLEQLTVNADVVVGELTANRRQLTRFIREARDTSAATADRQLALRRTFRLLPGFLRQLRPTMVDLGKVADEQIPTLRDLDAASGNLKAFLDELGPFSNASRPAIESLGNTAVEGQETIPPAKTTVSELNNFSDDTLEVSRNLAIVLDDLRDRDRAVEHDERAPNGKGYNGFEALLRYVWTQSQAINIFDQNGYILKVSLSEEEDCSESHDDSVKHEPEVYEKCASQLGPTQPGLFDPDPSEKTPVNGSKHKRHGNELALRRAQREGAVLSGAQQAAGPVPGPESGPAGTSTTPQEGTPPASTGPTIDITKSMKGLLATQVEAGPQAPAASTPASEGREAQLLNDLLSR
jgi:virulence factor Mce-like protein